MSWDIELWSCDDQGDPATCVYEWNLTYNLAPMIYAAGRVIPVFKPGDPSRFADRLAGPGPAGMLQVLQPILGELLEAPAVYRAMNPPNVWGSYDGLVEALADMVVRCREFGEWPTWWFVS
jgi:hypothetical protein